MSRILYLPDHKEVETGTRETILQASLRSGIPHTHACGGKARCSTCRVVIQEGLEHCSPRNIKEQRLADRLHFVPEIRLACQTTVNGEVKLRRVVLDEVDVALTSQLQPGVSTAPIGEEKKIAILFADISGYTPFAEALPPYDVMHVLNRYFHIMGQVITRNGGCISDYVGDGLVALFGVDDNTTAPFRAVKTGVEMLEAVKTLNPYLQAMYKRSFQIRIGVHYGEVVVGTVGIADTKKVAAIGDAVNLASRIEASNRKLGTSFLISEETAEKVSGQVLLNQCSIQVALPGKSGKYSLYEVLGLNKSGVNSEKK